MDKEYNSLQEIATDYQDRISQLVYPKRAEKPIESLFPTHRQYGEALDKWEGEKNIWRNKINEYRLAENNLNEEFKHACLKWLELDKHPKADRLWNLAWDYGHGSGLTEVTIYLDDLSDLLMP